ncbi:MAG: hypothetical protein ACRDMU_10535 [Gaiellaceae bacterium]
MRRAGAIGAAVVLLAAGCSGSDDGSDSSARTGSNPASPEPPPTTTARAEPEPAALPEREGWASRAELAWLRQYGLWSKRLEASLRDLVAIRENPALARELDSGDAEALARLERLMAPLITCGDDFAAAVTDAPTQRLAEAAGLVEAACEHYARVAEAGVEAARDGDVAAGQAWGDLRRAASASVLVSERLPPGEAQRLPIRNAKGKRSRINGRYSQIAGRLVETNVEVRCWAKRDWKRVLREASLAHGTRLRPEDLYGYVGLGSRRVNLAPEVCAHLDLLAYDRVQPRGYGERLLMSIAVGALAHESYHRAGIADEPTAECYGMQRIREAARALGARPAYADGLALLAWQTYDLLPRVYRSPECRDGGKLDLERIGGSPWP